MEGEERYMGDVLGARGRDGQHTPCQQATRRTRNHFSNVHIAIPNCVFEERKLEDDLSHSDRAISNQTVVVQRSIASVLAIERVNQARLDANDGN